MDFVNDTQFAAGWTMGFDADGRELIVIAIKCTFTIREPDEEPLIATEQMSLTETDQFAGEPGLSAPLCEVDYAHRKLACDVLLNASAYAQPGKMASQVSVGVRVGTMVKSFLAIGDRSWRRTALGLTATEPELFSVMPISYE